MHAFSIRDRDQPMMHTVSYRDIPMFRGLAFALHHIDGHGGHVDISSADRRVAVIDEHNRQFHTTLHAQQYLYDHQHDPGFNPASSPDRTSHCLRSDGTPVYKSSHGHVIPPGGHLPWFMLGIDLDDQGTTEHVSGFLGVAHSLGYEFVQPYLDETGERHHVVSAKSPLSTLEHWNQIAKDRA